MHSVLELRLTAPSVAIFVAAGVAAGPFASAHASVRAEVAFHRGVAAFGEGRLFEAEREFEAVLAEDPEDTAALAYLGLIAQGQGETDAAVAHFERALSIDPNDGETRLQLAIVLLEAGRDLEADVQLSTVRARLPGSALAQHYSGVAAYRAGRYAEAIGFFDSALAIDPELRLQARYYIGLCETFLRDGEGAMGAFAAVEQESPSHPLARSAAELRSAMRGPPPKALTAQASVGFEVDTNPLGIGDVDLVGGDDGSDVRGVFQVGVQYRPIDEPVRVVIGYDGFLSKHAEQTDVDQQTHLAWAGISAPLGPARIGLRSDVSWNAIDLSETFRILSRTIPTISLPIEDWGLAQLYYELQFNDYRTVQNSAANQALAADASLRRALDLDGPRHTVGVNQFVFFDRWIDELRAGVAYTDYDAEGTEFRYQGFEISAGGTVGLWTAELSALYRFQRRDHSEVSRFSTAGRKREDNAHRILVDLTVPVLAWLDASVFGRFTINDSNIAVFDFDRQVAGVNLTARY